MGMLRGLARLIVFPFNLLLGAFLLGVAFIGFISGNDLHIDELPGVEPESTALVLMGLGAFALLSTILAFQKTRPRRTPMFLWNLLVVGVLVCDLTRPSYRFDGIEHFGYGALAFFTALFALLGSWVHLSGLAGWAARNRPSYSPDNWR